MDKIRRLVIKIFEVIALKLKLNQFENCWFFGRYFKPQQRKCSPYKKLSDKTLYMNTLSNHPSQLIKPLLTSINERLSKNLSNEEIFNKPKTNYEIALKDS